MKPQLLFKITLQSLLIFIGSFASACALGQTPSDPALNRSDNEGVRRAPDMKEIDLPGGGRARLNADGWPIPDLTSVENIDEFKVQGAKPFNGTEIDVEAVKYRPTFGDILVSSDMAAIMGGNNLNVQWVNEYKAENRTFAYIFTVNQVELDKASNKIKSSRGFVFSFAVYDEDGDGRFETLSTGEPSVERRLRPHVPEWAANR